MIGKKLSPIILDIEKQIMQADIYGVKPNYDKEVLRASGALFIHALLDKMYENRRQDLTMDEMIKMSGNAGNEIREIIRKYTGEDSHDYYK